MSADAKTDELLTAETQRRREKVDPTTEGATFTSAFHATCTPHLRSPPALVPRDGAKVAKEFNHG